MKNPNSKIQITNKLQFLNVQNTKRTHIVLFVSFLHNFEKCFYFLVIVILYLLFTHKIINFNGVPRKKSGQAMRSLR